MNDTASPTNEILVVGAGMAAHRFVECLLHDPSTDVRVTVIGDEGHGPYDRSALVEVLAGRDPAELQLERAAFGDDRVRLIRDDRVLRIDPAARTVRTRARRTYAYDTLVLATGSFAARVAVDGARLPGCFVLRTIEDAESVREFVHTRSRILGRPLRGAVIGGGPPGLATAEALHDLGIDTTFVQHPEHLLPAELDQTAATVRRIALEEKGITVRTRARTTRLDPDESGAVTALEFQDGSFQRADIVIFTIGVHPRDELARNAGLEVHPRGGVIVDDRCGTSDENILAIGEAACFEGRHIDAVAPARVMAELAAARLLGKDVSHRGHDGSAPHGIPVVLSTGAGGEIAPGQLMAIGRIAEVFRVRPRITGAGVELRGARPEQSSALWEQLVAAGLVDGALVGADAGEAPPGQVPRDVQGRRADASGTAPRPRGQTTRGPVVRGWGERARAGESLLGSSGRVENPA
ncbi:NAD(P)/FAD-dependent oxidoreductase [Microbacterium sp. MYb62]|uniref:NAD(P)/FAD-dependent oxidoreductase n=1 Tax=Microbacterium sp. MYb62 TaxID=1848690 RepID=UPI0015E27634|nr:FAD-dependent oxidoreductase [Microbacterium sp. MYb62]